jgi:peptidoglycan-associated lipoprotein
MKYGFQIILLLMVAGFFQACGLTSQLKKADKKYEIGEYYTAADLYKRLYTRIPAKQKAQRANISFRQAECYRILNFSMAEMNYANAIRNGFADSVIYLRYAQVLHRNAKYKDAEKNYNEYLKFDSTNTLARNGLKLVKLAETLKKQPTPYVVKIADALNSRRSHTFSPAFQSTDGDMLFFTSDRQSGKKKQQKNTGITGLPQNAIYSCRKNAVGKWEKPELLSSESSQTVSADDGVTCFSSDGNTMYFSRARQQANSDSGTEIFVTTRAGGAWSEAKKLSIFKDSTISVAHPALSPDGTTLIFVSDSKLGKGGKDLWEATISGSEIKEIHNLGAEFNTEGDEMFPSFRHDGALFFASNGLPGLGGLDIFKATKQKNDSWIVENMGMPVNSNFDDFGITFEGKAEKGFFSSNRNEARGYDMLYSFELPVFEYVLEGKVIDEAQTPVADAVVRLVSNNGLNTKVQTKKDGTYRIRIDKDIECVLLATSRGFLNKGARISTVGAKQSKVFTQNFVLQTIFKPIQIENIFYEFGKWDLTPASEAGLQSLVKILNDNPTITIELSAHTDFVGDNESNKILSAKRAQSVVDYLIAAGIQPNRLTAVGYGEEKPFVVDVQTAQKLTYLKENDVLSEDYILKLTPTQQQEVNQINRRTEFRVLKTSYK